MKNDISSLFLTNVSFFFFDSVGNEPLGGNELSFFLEPPLSEPSCAPRRGQEMSLCAILTAEPLGLGDDSKPRVALGFPRQVPLREEGGLGPV